MRGLSVLAVAVFALLAWWAWGPSGSGADARDARDARATLSLEETLGGASAGGHARAEAPRAFRFPGDHGAHPDFRDEWWYLTGNLETAEGRRFGYQVTFFRRSLAPPGAGALPDSGAVGTTGRSGWRTRQAWMGHFALTDVEAGRFHAFERFERGALGLAGAETRPDLRVWTGTWELRGTLPAGATGPSEESDDPSGVFPLTLRASADTVAVELALEPLRGIVLQGDAGLSRKGPGEASYYYSFPRLRTTGRVTTPSGTFSVTGASWLDREWSTSVLPEGVAGWDWFALQLDDGRELMAYRLRREDGTPSPFSSGVVVEGGPGGEPVLSRLGPDDFSLEPLDRWTSPVDGAEYPVRWRLQVPAHGLDLDVRAVLEAQELDLAFRYWEGAVDARTWSGTGRGGGDVVGRGYAELTGYAGAGRPGR